MTYTELNDETEVTVPATSVTEDESEEVATPVTPEENTEEVA